jgi:hypothetical protein
MGQRNPAPPIWDGWWKAFFNSGVFTIYQLVQDFAGPSTVSVIIIVWINKD